MRVETLLSPGALPNGYRIRVEAAKAISGVEIQAGRTPGGKTPQAAKLKAFFDDASSKLAGFVDVVAPTISTAVASSATTLKLTFSEAMDQTVLPDVAAFAITGDTITGVAWGTAGDAGKLILTGTGFAAAETLNYTKQSTNFLRDRAGNELASGTKVVS